MNRIRVTKEFNFEMSHALWNYDGPCSSIHGHSYVLRVTIKGSPVQDRKNPKYGMVIDFGDLKKMVKSIIDEFDHALLIWENAPSELFDADNQMFKRLKITSFQPTCENLLLYFAGKIKTMLPEKIELVSLFLRETNSSFAEWYADDNK